ncbi:MAG: glycosyltransferase family 39 protein [Chloroflexota bacterium]
MVDGDEGVSAQIIAQPLWKALVPQKLHPATIVGFITLFGAGLRLYGLADKSLWLDEAVLYWVSRGGPLDVVSQNATQNSAPPLFALLVSVVSAFGDSELALRLLPALAGIASVPALYWLCRQFLPRDASYFCALLAAIAPAQIRYSQQAREYSLAFAIAIVMLIAYYRYLSNPSGRNWYLLVGSWSVGVLSQYGLALLLLALDLILALWLGAKAERRRLLTRFAAAQVLPLLTCLVVYELALRHQFSWAGFGASPTSNYLSSAYWEGSLHSLSRLAFVNTLEIFSFAHPLSILFVPLCLIGLVLAAMLPSGRVAVAMFAVPMLVTFAAACARAYPYHGQRQVIYLAPMIYVLAGFGYTCLLRMGPRRVLALVVALALVLSGVASSWQWLSSAGPENTKPVLAALSSRSKPEDVVYVYYGAIPAFRYYYRDIGCRNCVYGVYGRGEQDKYYNQLDQVLSARSRVWMVFSHEYSNEVELIVTYASRLRPVELVLAEEGAWLYVAD